MNRHHCFCSEEYGEMKFVILSPRQTGGGPIVLHKLCQLLREQGEDAYIFNYGGISDSRILFFLKYFKFIIHEILKICYIRILPNSEVAKRNYAGYTYFPVKGCPHWYKPWVGDDTIVVYPDVVYGNPMHAQKVVRYMLYYNRFPGDNAWYQKSDLFFSYREQFNDSKLNPTCRILQIFSFDSDLYKRTNFGKRHGNCYFIRKGSDRTDLPQKFDGPVLDTLKETEKVRILNQCERCYSYDTQSFYSIIASLCGCLSIVVPEQGKTRKDYVTPEDHSIGVAFGESPEEIKYALDTQGEIVAGIKRAFERNKMYVTSFISTCKNYFNKSDGSH